MTKSKNKKLAREVKVESRDMIRIRSVRDEEVEKILFFSDDSINMDIDFSGTHYGWSLKSIMKTPPVVVNPAYASKLGVSPNVEDDSDHKNTLAIQSPQLVKLDCGYWGSFLKNGKRRRYRDFGMIQGHWVWLCEFLVKGCKDNEGESAAYEDPEPYLPPGDTPVRRFFKILKEKAPDCWVKIRKYAIAPASTASEGLKDDELCFVFPDLHLPERWPDEPDDSFLNPKAEARKLLQADITMCQHAPGFKWFSDMTTKRADDLQKHLEHLIDEDGIKTWKVTDDPLLGFETDYSISRDEFLAEFSYVDRRIKALSTWFYGEGISLDSTVTVNHGMGGIPQTIHRSKAKDHRNVANISEKIPGDPSPAIELVCLLSIIKSTQEEANVKVVQLGDFFELWIGREFLLRYFPIRDKPLGRMARAACWSASVWGLGVDDEIQLRRDAGWRNPTSPEATGFKHYVFDKMNTAELLERHLVGNEVNPTAKFFEAVGNRVTKLNGQAVFMSPKMAEDAGRGAIGRLATLTQQRVQNVLNFCLPLPGNRSNPALKFLEKLQKGAHLERYLRPDNREINTNPANDEHHWSQHSRYIWPDGEYYWNRMIVEGFEAVGFTNIHGNHDGYRSDPLLNTGLPSGTKAIEYFDMPGIWFEHGHRWDEYNRDGRFYGAGMTNLVYYHFDEMIELDEGFVKDVMTDPAEQANEQPGAGTWFKMVNFLPKQHKSRASEKGDGNDSPSYHKICGFDKVKPFAIYCSGHTHGADLIRMVFPKPFTDAQKAQSDADKMRKMTEMQDMKQDIMRR